MIHKVLIGVMVVLALTGTRHPGLAWADPPDYSALQATTDRPNENPTGAPPQPPPERPPEKLPGELPGEPPGPSPSALPHIVVDLQNKVVDIEARVVLREGAWLELLACSPGTRTHESVLEALALPSHIHLALVMVGLEPGSPMHWRLEGQKEVIDPPHGPNLAVSVVMDQDGLEIEHPANEWIVDHLTGRTLTDNHWLFTGSSIAADNRAYAADLSGSVLSIVNFGDEVLARQTPMTNQNDGAAWVPNTPKIPPVGTTVLIRLRPLAEKNAPVPPNP